MLGDFRMKSTVILGKHSLEKSKFSADWKMWKIAKSFLNKLLVGPDIFQDAETTNKPLQT